MFQDSFTRPGWIRPMDMAASDPTCEVKTEEHSSDKKDLTSILLSERNLSSVLELDLYFPMIGSKFLVDGAYIAMPGTSKDSFDPVQRLSKIVQYKKAQSALNMAPSARSDNDDGSPRSSPRTSGSAMINPEQKTEVEADDGSSVDVFYYWDPETLSSVEYRIPRNEVAAQNALDANGNSTKRETKWDLKHTPETSFKHQFIKENSNKKHGVWRLENGKQKEDTVPRRPLRVLATRELTENGEGPSVINNWEKLKTKKKCGKQWKSGKFGKKKSRSSKSHKSSNEMDKKKDLEAMDQPIECNPQASPECSSIQVVEVDPQYFQLLPSSGSSVENNEALNEMHVDSCSNSTCFLD